ncbi:MAG: isoaspartyl peptidase/L-asparaginase [bacterium]
MAAFLTNYEGRPGLDAARESLASGQPALDAVEACIRRAEADPAVRSVGRGGTPDLLGRMQGDAAIIDGDTREAGSVGALEGFLHAISVARQVMTRLPHVMLVGDGAARFAREIGAEPANLLTPEAKQAHADWLRRNVPADAIARLADGPLAEHAWTAARTLNTRGTVIVLARDRRGGIAAGASTSGWAYRYPGRLGDSPIVGAGIYADSRFGACGCTHVGEMTIRAGTARSLVQHLGAGLAVDAACAEAMRDLADLSGGYLGPVVVHALEAGGRPCVLANRPIAGGHDRYFYWREGLAEAELRRAVQFCP